MFRFYTTLFILTGQVYLLFRILKYLKSGLKFPSWLRPTLIILFIVFNLPLIWVYFYIWRLTHLPEYIVTLLTPFFIWQMATLFIFLVLGITALIKLPFLIPYKAALFHPAIKSKVHEMKEKQQFQKFDATRRSFLQKGVIGLSAYSFIGSAAGVISKDEYDIIHQTVKIPNLPDEFIGFRIGMLSDVHSSVFMNKEDMAMYVQAMNDLKTDLVVVTGDFVNSQTEEVYPFAEAFSELKAPYGVYGCLGNHDYFAKNVDLVAKEVNDCGVRLLRNDAVKIHKGNSFFNLLGVDDIGRNIKADDYLASAMASAKNDQPKILLCHKPYFFENAKNQKIDLTLSGHTHGGQIVFGTIDRMPISLAAFASKYIAGLYSLDNSQLYVNRGLGSVGVPFRINCPPEVTVLTLT
ncbi:MAG: metallophosphoesterase [Bacteroidota bacterium]